MTTQKHKWEPSPTKAIPEREGCQREGCLLSRIPYEVKTKKWGKITKYHFKFRNQHVYWGWLNEKTPPCPYNNETVNPYM